AATAGSLPPPGQARPERRKTYGTNGLGVIAAVRQRRATLLAADVQSGCTQFDQDVLEMRTVARFDDELEQGRLGRQVGKGPLMRDFDDIGAGLRQERGDRRQLARTVDDIERKLGQP